MRTAKYFRNREHGDDRYAKYKTRGKFVATVFDGVSCSAGAAASQLARKWFKRKKPGTLDEVDETINEFHDWLTRHVGDEAQTTVAVAIIGDGQVDVASVGDSPVYLVDSISWSIQQLNKLDSWPDDPAVVTQVLGADEISVNKSSHKLPTKGYVLLCTDGISDNVAKEDLLGLCVDSPKVSTIVRRLKKTMKKLRKEGKGHVYDDFKYDDETLLVVKF